MPQSLTQLPKDAYFRILGWEIKIRNHKIWGYFDSGFFGVMMHIIRDADSNKQTLYQYEKHGISFEMVIECCAQEFEEDAVILANIITRELHERRSFSFSESAAGRKIAEQFIEKIRSCDDWGELYDEMYETSKFRKDIKNRIREGLEQQWHKV